MVIHPKSILWQYTITIVINRSEKRKLTPTTVLQTGPTFHFPLTIIFLLLFAL